MYILCSLSWSSLSLIRCSCFNKKLRHNKLLQATTPGYKGQRKEWLKGVQDYFRFWSWSLTFFLYYTTLILIYDMLSSFKLYCIHFKEDKVLWRPGPEDWGRELGTGNRIRGSGYGRRITQTPLKNVACRIY